MMRNGGRYAVAVRKADHEIEVKTEPFEKTPKGSIKRFLYS